MDAPYFIGMSNGRWGNVDVPQGMVDLMILQSLPTLDPSHGYAIASRLE
jgi:hypothetical protein